jgi:two-component system chemotaxis response regulator CheY
MPIRVLVVDDNDIARTMIKEILQSSGHQTVAEAESMDEAVKAYEAHKPDLVTLDLSLLAGDGLAVLKAIRKMDGQAKVLVISGNSQKKMRSQVLAAGACGFIEKPFENKVLLDAVSRMFPQ